MSCLLGVCCACRRRDAQYFLPAAKKGINHQIELAILRADRMGVKVLSLAALNKVSYYSASFSCLSLSPPSVRRSPLQLNGYDNN